MPKFEVRISEQGWYHHTPVVIEAENLQEAREEAYEVQCERDSEIAAKSGGWFKNYDTEYEVTEVKENA